MILFIIITIFISGIVYSLLTKQSLLESFFRMYQLSLQLSLNLVPKPWKLRIYIMFLLFFVMIMSSAYLSVLSGVFTRPSLEPRIRTLQQFFDSDIPLMAHERIIESFKSEVVEKKRKPWPKEKLIFLNQSLIGPANHGRYAIYIRLLGSDTNILQHDEVLVTDPRRPASFVYQKRLHLANLIDHHIRNIDETGHMQHYTRLSVRQDDLRMNMITHENVIVLTVVDLSGVFIIWLYGLAIATIVLIYEIIHHKREIKLGRILPK